MLTQRRPGDHINASKSSNTRPGAHGVQGELFLCLYDFETQEADQFSFKQNDVLTIVHKEPSGWWAAYLNGRVGWVPAAYLEPVRTTATINSRPGDGTRGLPIPGTSPNSLSSPISSSGQEGDLPVYTDDDDSSYLSPDAASDNYESLHQISGEYPEGPTTPIPSFSPTDPLVNDLAANFASASLRASNGNKSSSRTSGAPVLPAYAIYSSQATSPSGNYNYSRDPTILYSMSPQYDPPIPHQLSLVLEEGSEVDSQWSMPHAEQSLASIDESKGKRTSVPVSTASSALSAAALHQARLAQASIPWYLRPKYTWEELKLDNDGSVIGGTVQALIERLLIQSPSRFLV
jgi:son of sevenless-like protein